MIEHKDLHSESAQFQQGQAYPGRVPSQPVVWPDAQNQNNRIQQTKNSAKPRENTSIFPTTQPNKSSVEARTTPRHVSSVRVVLRKGASGQKAVTVQFSHPSGDPYFSGASVYLRRGNQQPTLVASGAKSPLTFNAPVNAAPHSVFVSSYGNWGETNVLTSPASRVSLR